MEPAPVLVAPEHMRTAWSRAAALEPRGALDVKVKVCCVFFSGTSPMWCWSCSSGETKEHRSRDWRKLFTCRLHGITRGNAACDTIKSARSCRAECASAVFLEENGALFTISSGPRK